MTDSAGVGIFALGTLAGQVTGAWVYRRVRGVGTVPKSHELYAATSAGLVTTVVASLVFLPLGLHKWLGSQGSTWPASIFIGLCIGICQAVLFRGRPLAPRTSPGQGQTPGTQSEKSSNAGRAA